MEVTFTTPMELLAAAWIKPPKVYPVIETIQGVEFWKWPRGKGITSSLVHMAREFAGVGGKKVAFLSTHDTLRTIWEKLGCRLRDLPNLTLYLHNRNIEPGRHFDVVIVDHAKDRFLTRFEAIGWCGRNSPVKNSRVILGWEL